MHRNPIHIRILKIYTLKACTTLVTYCRHMGHSASCRPHLTHVIMCPHSSNTQSTGASMHTLQRKSVSASVSVCVWQVYCVNVSIWDNVEHSTSNYCGQHEEPELKRDSPKYLMSCWSWAIVWPLTLGYVHLEPQLGLNTTTSLVKCLSWETSLQLEGQPYPYHTPCLLRRRKHLQISYFCGNSQVLESFTKTNLELVPNTTVSNVTSSHVLIYWVVLFAFQHADSVLPKPVGPLLTAIPVSTLTTANKDMKQVVDGTARKGGGGEGGPSIELTTTSLPKRRHGYSSNGLATSNYGFHHVAL